MSRAFFRFLLFLWLVVASEWNSILRIFLEDQNQLSLSFSRFTTLHSHSRFFDDFSTSIASNQYRNHYTIVLIWIQSFSTNVVALVRVFRFLTNFEISSDCQRKFRKIGKFSRWREKEISKFHFFFGLRIGLKDGLKTSRDKCVKNSV